MDNSVQELIERSERLHHYGVWLHQYFEDVTRCHKELCQRNQVLSQRQQALYQYLTEITQWIKYQDT